jgi:hypothetical protein
MPALEETNVTKLKDLAPRHSASYSTNLYRWLRARGTGRREGGVLDVVYKVKEGSRVAHFMGAGTLVIGHPYNGYEGDTDVSGTRVIEVLVNGAEAERLCLVGAADSLEPVPDFWERYIKIGRCAFDPQHKEHFTGTNRCTKTCLWCGAECADD